MGQESLKLRYESNTKGKNTFTISTHQAQVLYLNQPNLYHTHPYSYNPQVNSPIKIQTQQIQPNRAQTEDMDLQERKNKRKAESLEHLEKKRKAISEDLMNEFTSQLHIRIPPRYRKTLKKESILLDQQ